MVRNLFTLVRNLTMIIQEFLVLSTEKYLHINKKIFGVATKIRNTSLARSN